MVPFNLLHRCLSLQGVRQSPCKAELGNGGQCFLTGAGKVGAGWGREGEERHPTPRTAQKHTFTSNTAPIYKVVAVPGQLLEPDGDLHPMSPTLVLPRLP